MKVSELAELLNEVVKHEGDGDIWELEADFPCGKGLKLRKVNKIERGKYGEYISKKHIDNKNIIIEVAYEDGNLFDRSIQSVDEWEYDDLNL